MDLSSLRPAEGSVHSSNFRKGRGHASGNGKTAGKGHKGQKARAGYSQRFGFEGGQVSESLEAEVSQAEDLIYESVICDTVEADFSKEGIKSEVNVECENKSGELTVIKITVCGDFSQEEKAYMTDYLITCFKEAEINFKEEENG